MKKILPLLLLVVVILVSGCTEKPMYPEDFEWQTFEFPGVFTIEYPKVWTYPEGFIITQPQKTFKGEDFEVGVTVIETLEDETLDSVYQGIIREQESKGSEITYESDSALLDSPAKTAEIIIPEGRRQITLAMVNDKFVLFDYIAPEMRFNVGLPLAEYMRNSFKLL